MANNTKKQANLTTFSFAQDFIKEHWKWEPAEFETLGDCDSMAKVILKRLQGAGLEVIEAYIIKHDKDERELWNEYKNQYQTYCTSTHIHFVCKLAHGETLENIAEIIGIAPNFIEKPKTGRFSYDNMLSYLIHIKYPKKFQYDPNEVITVAGKEYMEHFREGYQRWMHGRAVAMLKGANYDLKDIKLMILDDKINIADLIFRDEYKYVYQFHKKELDKLIDAHREYKLQRTWSEDRLRKSIEKADSGY